MSDDTGFEAKTPLQEEAEQAITPTYPKGILGRVAQVVATKQTTPTLAALQLGVPRRVFSRLMIEGEMSALVSRIVQLCDEEIITEEERDDYLSGFGVSPSERENHIKPRIQDGWEAIIKASATGINNIMFGASSAAGSNASMFEKYMGVLSKLATSKSDDDLLAGLLNDTGVDSSADKSISDAIRIFAKRTEDTQDGSSPTLEQAEAYAKEEVEKAEAARKARDGEE